MDLPLKIGVLSLAEKYSTQSNVMMVGELRNNSLAFFTPRTNNTKTVHQLVRDVVRLEMLRCTSAVHFEYKVHR